LGNHWEQIEKVEKAERLCSVFQNKEFSNLQCDLLTGGLFFNIDIVELVDKKKKPANRNPMFLPNFASAYKINVKTKGQKELEKNEEVTLLSEVLFCKGTKTNCSPGDGSHKFNAKKQEHCHYAISWYVTAKSEEILKGTGKLFCSLTSFRF
jgi:hypothetical protein